MIERLTLKPHVAELSFEKEGHVYRRGGTVLPSVTGIIREARMTPFWNSEPGLRAQVGTWIHDMLHMYWKGTLDEGGLSDAMRLILDSVKEWAKRVGLVVLDHERPLFHSLYLYAGTPDLVGIVRGELAVVDYKWGDPRPADIVQLGGYASLVQNCYEEVGTKKIVGQPLYLKGFSSEIDKAKITGRTMEEAQAVFLAAHSCYRFRLKHGMVEKKTE
jgi:hypothetical protein